MFVEDGGAGAARRFIRPRVEVELAFVLGEPLQGPGRHAVRRARATDFVTPALEILDARVQMSDPETGHLRTIVDTIADNAADAGLVLGGRVVRPTDVDLRWVGALLYATARSRSPGWRPRCSTIPATAWPGWRTSLPRTACRCEAGRGDPVRVVHQAGVRRAGDTFVADYGPLGRGVGATLPLDGTGRRRGALAGRAARRRRRSSACGWRRAAPVVTEICAGSGLDWLLLDRSTRPTTCTPSSRSCRWSRRTR